MSKPIDAKIKNRINGKVLWVELSRRIREFYPYFLGFYILALFISLWSKIWQAFFYWPAFHGAIIVFTGLFVLTFAFNLNRWFCLLKNSCYRFGNKFKDKKRSLRTLSVFRYFLTTRDVSINLPSAKSFIMSFRNKIYVIPLRRWWKALLSALLSVSVFIVFVFIAIGLFLRNLLIGSWKSFKILWSLVKEKLQNFFVWIWGKLLLVKKRDLVKVLIIITILFFALIKNIDPLDFGILLYALVSFLFIFDSRWSASIALLCLAVCPVLLILKERTVLVESVAVYAYYFLIITVLTKIREMSHKGNHKIAANIE